MRRVLCPIALLVVSLAAVRPVDAADYYLSGAGDDRGAGTSAATPWRSLARANQAAFGPGDRILLAGGETFSGPLDFGPDDRGSPSQPIVVTSYGSGRATIAAGTGAGIFAYNTAGIAISNLVVTGSGAASNRASGIEFYADLPGDVLLGSVRIDSVEVSGFGQRGVSIGSWNGATGFRDVVVIGVAAHDNGSAGIATFAAVPNVHQNVYVGYSAAYDNAGIPGWSTNSGNGIVLGNTAGATVERCSAHGNGRLSTSPDGPVGIWAYDSTRVVLQANESYDNHTGSSADGDGFDLDQNVSDSVVQYNFSHDNDGAGFLLAQSPQNAGHARNAVRYNISQNDARGSVYGGIHVYGHVNAAEIYNNTVFVAGSSTGRPRAIVIANWGAPEPAGSAIHVRNNIFVESGADALIEADAAQAWATDLVLQGNVYFAMDGRWTAMWGGAAYSTFDAWRAASGQERADAVGSAGDPRLTNAGGASTVGDPTRLETLSAYHLLEGSSAIDAGVDLAAAGVSIGTRDFFNAPVPQGRSADAGASETSFSSPAPPAAARPYGGALPTLPGTFEAERFDEGGEGVAYHDTSAGNSGGAFRQTDVDIEAASGGGYDVGWVSPGEWLGYTVNVAAAGTYTVSARVAAAGGGGTFHFESGGQRVSPSITIPDTGGWQNWVSVASTATLSAGTQQLRVVMDSGGTTAVGNFDRFVIARAAAPSLPGTINAAEFDDGGDGASYHDNTTGNAGGAYRSTDVDIEPASDGGYDVGWIDRGEWLNYSVDVAAAGQYLVAIQVASPSGGGALHVGFNGPSSVWVPLTVPATGGWQNWTTVSAAVWLGAGRQQITLLFDSPGFNVRAIEVRPDDGIR